MIQSGLFAPRWQTIQPLTRFDFCAAWIKSRVLQLWHRYTQYLENLRIIMTHRGQHCQTSTGMGFSPDIVTPVHKSLFDGKFSEHLLTKTPVNVQRTGGTVFKHLFIITTYSWIQKGVTRPLLQKFMWKLENTNKFNSIGSGWTMQKLNNSKLIVYCFK